MPSKASTPEEYFTALPEDRKAAMDQLRKTILKHLPKGFKEGMSYGMPGFCVPLSRYPEGYHCDPKTPLPFMSIASQKNFVALYHMGLYAEPKLLRWFTEEYPKHSATKLDMGKGCVRFKKPDQIPFKLVGELASKMSVEEWIGVYEKGLKKKSK